MTHFIFFNRDQENNLEWPYQMERNLRVSELLTNLEKYMYMYRVLFV